MKKTFFLLLLLTLMAVCAPAMAEISWTLDEAGTLTISGNGDMPDYDYNHSSPFAPYFGYIKEVIIMEGIKSIGNYSFYGCSNIASISVPNSVTKIGYDAFNGCSSLASISIPDSVTSIGSFAFRGCSSLASISIPDGIASIDHGVFYGCSSLTSISIPNSVAVRFSRS